MKVNLIKDSTVVKEIYTDVYDILTSVPGPIKFSCDNDSLVNFDEFEYYKFKKDDIDIQEFELKKGTDNTKTDMVDVIIRISDLLKSNTFENIDVEIDLPCPFCEENVFMVILPLGNYPIGYCKKHNTKFRNRFHIKRYIESAHKFTWEEFLNKIQQIKGSNKYIEEIRELEFKESEKSEKVTNWEILFNKCSICMKQAVIITGDCSYCYYKFCNIHRLPEYHQCISMKDCRTKSYDENYQRVISQKCVATQL